MLRPYLKIWEWELIFGCAVKLISSPCVNSPWFLRSTDIIFNPQKTTYIFSKTKSTFKKFEGPQFTWEFSLNSLEIFWVVLEFFGNFLGILWEFFGFFGKLFEYGRN